MWLIEIETTLNPLTRIDRRVLLRKVYKRGFLLYFSHHSHHPHQIHLTTPTISTQTPRLKNFLSDHQPSLHRDSNQNLLLSNHQSYSITMFSQTTFLLSIIALTVSMSHALALPTLETRAERVDIPPSCNRQVSYSIDSHKEIDGDRTLGPFSCPSSTFIFFSILSTNPN